MTTRPRLRAGGLAGVVLAVALAGGCTSASRTAPAAAPARTPGPTASAASAPAPAPSTPAPPAPVTPTSAAPTPPAATPAPATAPAAAPPPRPAPAAGSPAVAGAAGRPLAGRTVVLDAGHNGGNAAQPRRLAAPVDAGGFTKPCNTAGTSTDAGYPEHAFTFDVVARASALLRARGATVVLTRPDDAGFGPCVDARAALANRASADATVSVHADGGPPSGLGFHVIAPALAPNRGNAAVLGEGLRLAEALRAGFRVATGEPYATYTAQDGLVRRSDLAGLDLARVPAAFIECGNMRNAADAARLSSPAWREQAATGIADAVQAYLSGR